jgi:Domain of unknown function (DUF4381)
MSKLTPRAGTRLRAGASHRPCTSVAIGLFALVSTAVIMGAAAAGVAPAEDIRDIRGPKGIFPLWLVAALLAGAVLLTIAGYTLWRWRRRRPPARVLQPFEIALQALEDIRGLLDPASVREFSIAITDIVRKYIEDAFHVTATHRTTEEFLHDLLETSNASLAAHRNLLAEFLNRCDMAKFAGMSLSRQIMESLHQSARSFVIESSKPVAAAQNHDSSHSSRVQEAHDSLPTT